jgi:predicted metalloendopeptidase
MATSHIQSVYRDVSTRVFACLIGQQKFSDHLKTASKISTGFVTRLKAQEGLTDVKSKKKPYTEKSVKNLSLNSSWLSVTKNAL